VWSPRDQRPLRKTFATVADARAWRQEMQVAVRRGRAGAPSAATVRSAALEWLDLARSGVARTRSGDHYKPSAIRSYETSLHALLPEIGHLRLSALTRNHLQDIVDRLVATGRAPSTVRNTILPLRAIYRRATSREQVTSNPTLKLTLPAVRARRDRVARPEEATALIAAAPDTDRAIWALALYAGLRLGELRALHWDNIDLDNRLIHIEHAWDPIAGLIEPKSRSGKRRVPMTNTLRTYLIQHRLQQGHTDKGLALGQTPTVPFNPWAVTTRARSAWKNAELNPIGFHECRHTYAAFMIAAGINPKALSTYMGHSTITITLDCYGHLLPGNEHQAATMLETWLQQTSKTEPTSARTSLR
jgi:integrase